MLMFSVYIKMVISINCYPPKKSIFVLSLGCYGGFPIEAWQYSKNHGLVTGGNYESGEVILTSLEMSIYILINYTYI